MSDFSACLNCCYIRSSSLRLSSRAKGIWKELIPEYLCLHFSHAHLFFPAEREKYKYKYTRPVLCHAKRARFLSPFFYFLLLWISFSIPPSLFKRRKKDIRPGGIRNDRENPLKREAHLFDPKVAPWRKVERRRRLKEIRLPKGMDGWMKKHNTEEE